MPLKNSELDILNEDHVKHIINEIESDENIARKEDAYSAFQIRCGNQKPYVIDKLKETYPKTWLKFRVGDISLASKVDSKLSTAYKTEPTRELDNDTESEELTELYKTYKFNRAFNEADEIFNAYKYVAMWLSFINPKEEGDDGKYNLQALAPYDYDVVRDEITGEVLIFILNFPDSAITHSEDLNGDGVNAHIADYDAEETKKYALWTKDNHVQAIRKKSRHNDKLETTTEIVINQENPNQENVLGMLPISFLSKSSSVDYPVPSNLHWQSVEWNVSLSDLKTGSSAQGHGQLVIEHPEGQPVADKHMGMHTAISLPQSKKPDAKPTKAYYISAAPDLANQLAVLKFDASNILDEHGIKAKGGMDGSAENFASGLDRALSMADVTEIVECNQSLYKECLETDVYHILKRYEEALNKNTFKSENIMVAFAKPMPIVSTKELLEEIRAKRELNIIEDYEALIILNPNLTVEQAKDKLAKIKEENKSNMEENMAMMEAQSSEDEPPVIEEDE